MIKLVDVSKYYNSNGIITIALQHINLEFKKNDIVAITGESGSGKSTLLNVICQNDTYDDGEIYFKGNETAYFDVNDQDNFKNKYIGFIYQNYNIIDSYTVLQNVMFPLLLKGEDTKVARNKALELIEKVGLSHRAHHKGTKLSGGEKQRVVIARALAQDPEILACDEPTGNLDSETSKEIIELIKEIAKDKLVLIVTHNYEEVKDIATRKVTLVDGKVIEDREIKEVEDDSDGDLVLEKQNIKVNKTLLFTKNNILSTPKKTIFTFLILFVMAFAILSLFQSINYSFANNVPSSSDQIAIYDPNYIVVNKSDHTELNRDDFSSFKPEEINYYSAVSNISMPSSILNSFVYTPFLPEYYNLVGAMPQLTLTSTYQALIILPADINAEAYSNWIGRSLVMSSRIPLVVSGVCNSNYVSKNVVYTCTNLSTELYELNYFNLISAYIEDYNKNVSVSSLRLSNISKPTLYLPQETLEIGQLKLKYNDIYEFEIEYDIAYGQYSYPVLYFPSEFDVNSLPIFEVGIYTTNSRTIKSLENMGYNVYLPYDNTDVNMELVLRLLILSLVAILPVIFIYFMAYLIVRAIYLSKFRNYLIMRSIGLNKKSMKKTLALEIFIISIISSIITFVINIILGYGFNISLYQGLNAYIIIVFFSIMILFGLFLGIRLSNKLFKKASAQLFKEEV